MISMCTCTWFILNLDMTFSDSLAPVFFYPWEGIFYECSSKGNLWVFLFHILLMYLIDSLCVHKHVHISTSWFLPFFGFSNTFILSICLWKGFKITDNAALSSKSSFKQTDWDSVRALSALNHIVIWSHCFDAVFFSFVCIPRYFLHLCLKQ